MLDGQNLGFPVGADGALPGELRELWSGAVVPAEPVTVQSDAARGVAPGSAAVRLDLPAHGSALLRLS